MAVVVAAENTVQGEQTMVVAATTGDSAYRLVVAAGTVETAGSTGAAVGTVVGVLAEVDVVDVINLVWL